MSRTKMTRFEVANKATDAVKMAIKLPMRKKAIVRAFESSVDSVTEMIFDLKEEIDDLRESLYKADKSDDKTEMITDLAEKIMEVEEAEKLLVVIKNEKEKMDEEVEIEVE